MMGLVRLVLEAKLMSLPILSKSIVRREGYGGILSCILPFLLTLDKGKWTLVVISRL